MQEFDFLKKSHAKIMGYATELRFDKNHPYHFALIALHGSIIELSHSIIVLLENDGYAGIPSVFRTLLETIVELINLSEDKKYGYNMDAAHLEQWLGLLKSAKKGNPYLKDLAEGLDLNAEIASYRKKRNELKVLGYEQLNPWKRFKRAGMVDEFNSIYSTLSADSHCNKSALISRHFELKERDFKVVFFKDESPKSFLDTIYHTVRILIGSAITLHKELDSGKADEISSLHREYDAIIEASLLVSN